MRLRLLSIFFFFSPNGAFAQRQITIQNGKIVLRFNPLYLLDDFSGCSYRLGIEGRIYQNVTLNVEGGGYIKYFQKEILHKNSRGYSGRIELRYYMKEIEDDDYVRYYAIECFRKHQIFEYTDSIKIAPDPTYAKQYTIYRDTFDVNFKFGYFRNQWKRITWDLYWGVGIRFKNSSSNLSDIETDHILKGENHGDIIGGLQRDVGNRIYPNLPCGFRIGYRIK